MTESITFSQSVKDELTTLNFTESQIRAVLAAYIKINGTYQISSNKGKIILKTRSAKTAKFIHECIEKIYGINGKFTYRKSMRFNKKTIIFIVIDNGADDIIDDLEISFLDGKISKNVVHGDELIASYLTGAFLASGSVNSPKSSNYHLEIVLNEENYAKWFSKLIHNFKQRDFDCKTILRRNRYVVYIQKSDQIVDFLIFIGATTSALDFENTRIDREFSNIGNRLQNLDVSNYEKTVSAAKQQKKNIELILKYFELEKIPNEKKREIMRLRLENEDMSMKEIAAELSKKLGKTVTKSNINHIFISIEKEANRLRKNK